MDRSGVFTGMSGSIAWWQHRHPALAGAYTRVLVPGPLKGGSAVMKWLGTRASAL